MDFGSPVSGDWRLAARRVPGERGTSVPWLWFLRLCNWTYARVPIASPSQTGLARRTHLLVKDESTGVAASFPFPRVRSVQSGVLWGILVERMMRMS